ncbi:MAG: hypothetical protein N2444_00115 [Methylocystis sp.]|nr:hypothetical protein [Methylocystis sp.]
MSSAVSTINELIMTARARHGVKTPEARRIVAREIGVKPGSIERLLAGRLVNVEKIVDRVSAHVARRIERKIEELEREIELARLSRNPPCEADIARAEAALEEARKAIGE